MDSNWLDPSKALAEQGVNEDSHLIYKKKFFVDDGFISTDDPASIHLLYMEVSILPSIIHMLHDG